ncbi:MAG TPA: glycoside hydrolase family 44 protein, partial [Opitutus sp.]|nr:glycoside hydrolase family 44 protein [Opitutus sp.]
MNFLSRARRQLLPASVLLLSANLRAADSVQVFIDFMPTPAEPKPISPYIYGSNAALPGVTFPLLRQGGNRMTGYNWENNASNAGHDYRHQNDNFLTWVAGLPDTLADTTPGLVLTHFHDAALDAGTSYSILTLPMAGYVAADKSGPVTAAQAAPSARWLPVANQKPAT